MYAVDWSVQLYKINLVDFCLTSSKIIIDYFTDINILTLCEYSEKYINYDRYDTDHNISRYFTATSPSAPGERHLYRVSDSGSGGWECLTCSTLLSNNNTSLSCSFSQSIISVAGQAFIQVSSIIDQLFSLIHSTL